MAKLSPTGLWIDKTVTPGVVASGQRVTYTLVYANESMTTAVGVLITDVVPITLTNVSFASSGAQITPTGGISYIWQVEPLAPGAGGVIVITGTVGPSLSAFTLTNRATITTTDVSYVDPYLGDNETAVRCTVVPRRLYLPLIMRAHP